MRVESWPVAEGLHDSFEHLLMVIKHALRTVQRVVHVNQLLVHAPELLLRVLQREPVRKLVVDLLELVCHPAQRVVVFLGH